MGIVASFIDRRVGTELDERGTLVWYDTNRVWQPWIQSIHGKISPGEEAAAAPVTIGGRDARLVVCTGSHYEVLQACEPLVSGSEPRRLLVYVPGEPYLETLSPLRELECLGGEKEPFQRELTQVARQALQSAGLSESKIDELLNRDGLDFTYLDSISVGDGGASPLGPVFGSSREIDVLPSFLAEPDRRATVTEKGLLPEVARLATSGCGLQLRADLDAESMSEELARLLLIAEMRADLDGPEPSEISQIDSPNSPEQLDRARAICRRLRHDFPNEYVTIADQVQKEFGLAQAKIDPQHLGQIDTFRFEEQHLLEACDQWLAGNLWEKTLEVSAKRLEEGSFWVNRDPVRHGAWLAISYLSQLAQQLETVERELRASPSDPEEWIERYCRQDGWHRLDYLYRTTRHQLSMVSSHVSLDLSTTKVFGKYEDLIRVISERFISSYKDNRWAVSGIGRQEETFSRFVDKRPEPVAYLLADALRFEMGIDLSKMVESIGAEEIQIDPAIAVAPTITDLGMVALLPNAEKSFSMAEISNPKGIAGSIQGRPLVGSAARMEFAKGEVPGLKETTLENFVHGLSAKKRVEFLKDCPVFILRSQEIDGIGENVPAGIARRIMGTVLEDLRTAIKCVADAGINHFVVTADHGHLFAESHSDDMKIEPPKGGKQVDLHRRCWVGKGGDTPYACVRLSPGDLGYEGTDLELVVPKGTGIFKAGGSTAFHHGGLSLQELVVPVLRFRLDGKPAIGKKHSDGLVLLEGVDSEITNRIFSLRLIPKQFDMLSPLQMKVVGVSATDESIAAQVGWASEGWDPEKKTVTFVSGESVEVRMLLDDASAAEIRIVVVQVTTQRTLAESSPIPVEVIE